jgi:uncharacterized protein (TIGR00369 family)
MSTDTDLRALVESVTARPGHTSAIGTRVVSVERGRVQMEIDRRPDLLQFSGFFHGGVIAALADHAAGGAVTTALPSGRIAVTIDLHVNYLAPAKGDVLCATARAIQVGSTIGVAHVDLTTRIDGTDQACAAALVTLRVVEVGNAVRPVA